MSLRCTQFTSSGTFSPATNVSGIACVLQGDGGGGDCTLNFQNSKGSGGAGEFRGGLLIAVPNPSYTVTIGPGGLGAVSNGNSVLTPSTDGSGTSFDVFVAAGGLRCPAAAGASTGGNGGGGGGGAHGITSSNIGKKGIFETPTSVGGAGGSTGGSSSGGNGNPGGPLIGQYASIGGAQTSGSGSGGAGGGSTVLGAGGNGAIYDGHAENAPPVVPYGGGGGGGSQNTAGGAAGRTGANGGQGLAWVFYLSP